MLTDSKEVITQQLLALYSQDPTGLINYFIEIHKELPKKGKKHKLDFYKNMIAQFVADAGYEPSIDGFHILNSDESQQPIADLEEVYTKVEGLISKELFDMPSNQAKEHPYKDILDRKMITRLLKQLLRDAIGVEVKRIRDKYRFKGEIVDVMETLKMMLRAFHNNNPVSEKDLEAEALGFYQFLHCFKRKLYNKSAYRPLWMNHYTTKQKVGKSYHCDMISGLVAPFDYIANEGLDSLKDRFDKSGGQFYSIQLEELSGTRADIAFLKAKVTNKKVNMRGIHSDVISKYNQIATYHSNSNHPISSAIGADSENTRFLEIAWGTERVVETIDKWVEDDLYVKLFCSINENIDIEPIDRPEYKDLEFHLFNEVMAKQLERHPLIEVFMDLNLQPGEHLIRRKDFNNIVDKLANEGKRKQDDYSSKFIRDKLTSYFEGNQSFYKRKTDGEYYCFNKKFDIKSMQVITTSEEKTLD